MRSRVKSVLAEEPLASGQPVDSPRCSPPVPYESYATGEERNPAEILVLIQPLVQTRVPLSIIVLMKYLMEFQVYVTPAVHCMVLIESLVETLVLRRTTILLQALM